MYSKEIDKKWQKFWEENKIAKFNKERMDKKYYCLEMFSYPSGAKLHVGHWYNYGPVDSFARYKKMQGYEVFQPMGFDSFGLPAENYAIKTGTHPYDSTMKNIETMEGQLKAMGAMFNWDNEIITCKEDYYKWTQWIFRELYKKGLAYRKKANVNWCPSCNTVLANEQVIDGKCERCDNIVTKKDLTQWFFKITEYAEELLNNIDSLDWPEKTKKIQKNWIGKSTGSVVEFAVADKDLSLEVFTTRVDTLCGVSYVVVAPEHEIVAKLTTEENKAAVEEYCEKCKLVKEIDRLAEDREKTGVFTGSYAINPITGAKVQVWVADYVLATYGTGCVMAVPAHDDRDFAFAKKYNLPVNIVITNKEGNVDVTESAYTESGVLVNSGKFDGMSTEDARNAITEELKKLGKGDFKVTYRLRDWLVSRQRYWGCPIPVVYCDKCGTVLVEDLPVKLPYNVEFKPDGKSPLAKCEEYVHTTCPKCGGKATRETDTLDTFVCSSWYQFRYPDAHNSDEIFNPKIADEMLPVDKYVGGPEHAAMHLLYARFITKVLRDIGLTKVSEPFKSLVHQGLILGPDGNKMSKSKGNVISPDTYVDKFGSDVFRMYLMFGFSYTEGGPWNEDGVVSMSKFVGRLERLLTEIHDLEGAKEEIGAEEKELLYIFNNNLKTMTDNLEKMQFNTAVAKVMEITNAMYKYMNVEEKNVAMLKELAVKLIKAFAPLAPHFAEEMFAMYGSTTSVFLEEYPMYDEKYMVKDEIELGVSVNGKPKFKIVVSKDATEEEVKEILLKDENLETYTHGNEIRKIIVIKGRLVNVVI